ncbi:MAG: porin [Methylococcales bacterium]
MNKTARQVAKLCVLGAVTLTTTSIANAGHSELLDVLLKNGAINKKQYEELAKGAQEKEQKKDEEDVKVSLKKGQLVFKSDDDEFKFQVGGRLMLDAAWYDNDDVSKGDADFGNGTEIRRARVFVKGTLWNDWHFKGQYDFAGNTTNIKDAYIKYTGLKETIGFPLDITMGNFKEPFSLEELTSSRFITFMERGMPNVFAPSRNLGVQLSSHGEMLEGGWSMTGGAFGTGVDDNAASGIDESYAGAGRFTLAPIANKTQVVHLGGGVEYRILKGDAGNQVRVRQRPDSHIADHRLVDARFSNTTGNPLEGDLLKYGGEAAVVWGPFSTQGEYIIAEYDIDDGPSPEFEGWYAYASLFLTGESRSYKAKNGTFSRVKPKGIVGKGGWGAWEIAGRYSYIDLNDDGVEGGREGNWTVGLNWYATPSIRLMANVIFADADLPNGTSDNPNVLQLRGQVDF